VETFLTILAAEPDTHIARRAGPDAAARVSRLAQDVRGAGGVRSVTGRAALADLDEALRDPDNRANPGTTADLTAAAIFVVLMGRGWRADSEGTHAATR
jgi:triphosphoribosyl-dephospho-CoA synthase